MMVYLDDNRETPTGWSRTYTVEETIRQLKTRQVTYLSLDNDLGDGQPEGYKVLDWLEEEVYNDPSFPMPVVTIHSSNTVREQHMLRTLLSIERIRTGQVEMEEKSQCPDCRCELPETNTRLVYADWVKEVPIVHTPERCENNRQRKEK